MEKLVYGTIDYNGKSYPFLLEGRRVNIVGAAWQFYDDFQEADYEEAISGTTSDNRQIMFLRCRFEHSTFQNRTCFSPIGYILSKGNIDDSYDFTFEKVSFYSEAINSFFPPQSAFEANFDPNNWNGEGTLTFKPFTETGVAFNFESFKCTSNISRYITMRPGKTDIGSINSDFSFEFDNAQHCIILPKYWLAVFDFLSFVNYGTNIQFDKIKLYKRRPDGLYERNADAYIFSNQDEYIPRPAQNTITVNDIPTERLGAVFSNISSLRGRDERLGYYFPRNFRERFQIDATRWLVAALNFDGLSASCYPDFKQNQKEQFRIAKTAALNALDKVDQSDMNRKICGYFKDCCEQIVRYEGLLEEKFNFLTEKYMDALEDILSYNLQKHNLDAGDYGVIYSRYRNKIAHGEVSPVGGNEVAVYRVMQALIYYMLLEGTGLDNNTLRVIAKKLFL